MSLVVKMNSCKLCEKAFTFKYSLKRHEEQKHGILIHFQNESNFTKFVFETNQDFMQWKSEMEVETISSYISERFVNKSGTKYRYHYYECSRSGSYQPQEERKRRLKSQSTSKIGRRCPSRIVVSKREKLFVKFFYKHEGHDMDLKHLRLPKTTKEFVAGKLKEGVPVEKILDVVKEEAITSYTPTRTSLITRKDLRNIKYSCNIGNQRHKQDGVSASRRAVSKEVSHTIEQGQALENQSEDTTE